MHSLAHAEAWIALGSAWLPRLADVAVKGTILLAAAVAAAALLRRSSAAARHLVWSAAVGGVLLLLAAAPVVPAWEVPLLPSIRISVGAADVLTMGQARRESAANPVAPRRASPASPASSPASFDPELDGAVAAPPSPTSAPVPAPAAPAALATLATVAGHEQAVAEREPGRSSAVPLAPLVLAVWAGGALFILIRLGAGTLGVARLARQAEPMEDAAWTVLAQRLARRLGIRRPVTLLIGNQRSVPVTWGVLYPVILLPADALAWRPERRRLVLLHELAHVGRLDALTCVVTQLASAAFWFNPLVWLAGARVRAEAERACDDVVLVSGERASRYADDLLELASTLDHAAPPAFAALAMARRTEIEGRLLAILDPGVRRARPGRAGTVAALAGAAMLTLPLAALRPRPLAAAATNALGSGMLRTFGPAEDATADGAADPAAENAASAASAASADGAAAVARDTSAEVAGTRTQPQPDTTAPARTGVTSAPVRPASGETPTCEVRGALRSTGTHIHIDDSRGDGSATTSYTIIENGRCLSIKSQGVVEFTDDETDVLRLGPGAYFAATESRGGVVRSIEITPAPDGSPQRRYTVNGDAADAREASRWLGEILPELIRELAVNPGPRVARIRRERGVAGVLDEIGRTKSDHAKRVYFETLLESGGLTPDTLRQVARLAGRAIASDGDKASVLASVARAAPNDRAVTAEVIAAARTIASDGDKRRVLETVLDDRDAASLVQVAEAAREISSDGDKAAVLTHMAPRFGSDAALRQAYFATARTISSDGDLRRVLTYVLDSDSLDPPSLTGLLAAAREIASDGDRSAVLIAVGRRYSLRDGVVRRAFFEAANGVASDHDRSTVLRTVLEQGRADAPTMLDVLSSAEEIASDHDKSTVLLDVVRRSEIRDPAVRKRFFEVVKTISSSSDYRRVMDAAGEQ